MKKITAFIHHVRSADVIEALRDAGYKNISLLDIKGTLKPLGEQQQPCRSLRSALLQML